MGVKEIEWMLTKEQTTLPAYETSGNDKLTIRGAISSGMADNLALFLKDNKTITHLYLGDDLSIDSVDWTKICEALFQNKTITNIQIGQHNHTLSRYTMPHSIMFGKRFAYPLYGATTADPTTSSWTLVYPDNQKMISLDNRNHTYQVEQCAQLNLHLNSDMKLEADKAFTHLAQATLAIDHAVQPEIQRLGTSGIWFSNGAKGLAIQKALKAFKENPTEDNLRALTGTDALNRARIFSTTETTAHSNVRNALSSMKQ